MEDGKIKKLTDRGFGFIAAGDGTEVFFHRNECQEVTFDRESGEKGPRARNVRPKTST
jgi:CspA family cold shock protein